MATEQVGVQFSQYITDINADFATKKSARQADILKYFGGASQNHVENKIMCPLEAVHYWIQKWAKDPEKL